MNNHFYKPILLIILISAFFQFTPIDVEAHKSGYTYQAWAPAAPTIDGNIGSEEWKYAATGSVDFGGGYTGTFYVMNNLSFYNFLS